MCFSISGRIIQADLEPTIFKKEKSYALDKTASKQIAK